MWLAVDQMCIDEMAVAVMTVWRGIFSDIMTNRHDTAKRW